MQINLKHVKLRRVAGLIAGSVLLSLFFQNCGQPGSISSKGGTELNQGGTPTPTPGPSPTPTPGNPVYKYLDKDVTVNSTSGQVDVLVVIDNSGSMKYEQKSMSERFSTFIDQLQGLDWRVAITTTSVSKLDSAGNVVTARNDGKLVQFKYNNTWTNRFYLKSSDGLAYVKQAFGETIKRSEEGSSEEQGIRATKRAIERARDLANSANAAFLRPNAALAVVVVTDSDETPDNNMPVEENLGQKLRNLIASTYPSKAFKFHSIIVKKGDEACLTSKPDPNLDGNEDYGLHYQDLSEATGGTVGSVCELDYGSQLKQMGQSTADLVKQVSLECAPVDQDKNGLVDVKVHKIIDANTKVEITSFKVEGSQINFDPALDIGNYKVSYTCLQSESN